MKILPKLTLNTLTFAICIALISLTACSNMTHRDRNAAIGAGVGAVAGSALSDGSAAGTVGGAVVGGVIGHQVY